IWGSKLPTLPLREGRKIRRIFRGGVQPGRRTRTPPRNLLRRFRPSLKGRVEKIQWTRSMYRYDEFDARFVAERVEQFRGQVARRLSGELTEDQFKPLRLMNGLYLQLHAYMLRV